MTGAPFNRHRLFSELGDPDETQEGVLAPSIRRNRAAGNLGVVRTVVQQYDLADLTNGGQETVVTIPAGGSLLAINARITTAFDSGTTDTIDIGTTEADPDEYVDAQNAQVLGLLAVVSGSVPDAVVAADTPILLEWNGAGTAATVGAVEVYIEYFVPQP